MANYTASDTDLTAVADAIRTKAGYAGQQLQFPAGFVNVVNGIETRKPETTLTATANDTYTPPTGSVYSSVTVNVPQTTVTSLSVTENGTYTAPSGTAYSPVTVEVAGSSVATVHITTQSTSGVGYYTGSDFTIKSPQPNPATGFVVYDDDMVVGTLLWDASTVRNSHLQLVTGSSRGGYLYQVIA